MLRMKIRTYSAEPDFPAVKACFIALQEFERALDPRLPSGAAAADAYLEGLFRRCQRFAGQVFVVEAADRVVGFVSVLGACRSDSPDDPATPFAYVDDLVVLPEHRGRGYGRALLARAEAYAADLGQTTLRLRVKGGNQPARGFYAGAGYTEYEIELQKEISR
ncbi:MAG TPA: GNAT family N-acetyltransferase [Propionibacteriaceae bacterium]|nr:GNAT family N-acetyltransferase [Propionibacteriaceae bacterium]